MHATEEERQQRLARAGLTIGRTALQTFREGCSYPQFKEKLLNLYLFGVDIGSMNHSAKFIEGYVDSMAVVMDMKIKDHIHGIDHVKGRKRLSAFAADKVTKLHMIGDAIGMLIMTEEGELESLLISSSTTCWSLSIIVTL
jgi:hypothetical protein